MGTKKCPHKDFEYCHPCGNVMNFLHAHTDRHTHRQTGSTDLLNQYVMSLQQLFFNCTVLWHLQHWHVSDLFEEKGQGGH